VGYELTQAMGTKPLWAKLQRGGKELGKKSPNGAKSRVEAPWVYEPWECKPLGSFCLLGKPRGYLVHISGHPQCRLGKRCDKQRDGQVHKVSLLTLQHKEHLKSHYSKQ